jgi:integrase
MTIRQRGNTFQAVVRLTVNGHKYEDSRTFATERLAKDWKARTVATVKLYGVPQRVKSTMTLGELIRKYKDAINDVKPMRRQMEHEMEQLAKEFNDVKLNQLSARTFTDFGRKRVLEGTAAGSTILHNLSTISSVLGGAKPVLGVDVDASTVKDAIVALTRIGAVSRSTVRSRRPTDAELLAILTEFERIAAYPSTVIPMATLVKLAVQLPRRLGELTSMRWEDYDGVTVKLFDTKNPVRVRNEVVPVPPSAKEIIDAIPRIDGRILPYNSESCSAAFERVCIRLGIKDLKFHDLRHEGITRLFEKGLAIEEVAEISGHSSWNMLRRYTHIKPEAIVDKLSRSAKLREFSMENL